MSFTNSEIESFQPPVWNRNGHLQTIGCSLLSRERDPYHRRIELATPDGDFLDLDILASGREAVFVLFHGLEGSSHRYYIAGLAEALAGQNSTVVAVNFRSCSGRLNRKKRFYHSGETGDLELVFGWVSERFPSAPVGAVGFSLGGNALLKSLGELGAEHPLDAAAAVSVPYRLDMGARVISQGINRIYEYNFLRSMKRKLELKRRHHPELPVFEGNTLYEYDQQVTAPLHGFRDAEEYYRTCSALHYLEPIRCPTLLVHSRKDPICPESMIPEEQIRAHDALHPVITGDGGHVGFWSTPPGWLNRTIVNYFTQIFDI